MSGCEWAIIDLKKMAVFFFFKDKMFSFIQWSYTNDEALIKS